MIIMSLALSMYSARHFVWTSYVTLQGRDRLEIQIKKLNEVSSYLIEHTVSQIQLKVNACIYGQHQWSCKQHSKPWNRPSRPVLRFPILVSELSKRSLGFGEFDVESDIRISNRSNPKMFTKLMNYQTRRKRSVMRLSERAAIVL